VKALENANLVLRFLLELGALAAVALWGWKTGDGVLRVVLPVVAVSAVVTVWALFVSPKRKIELPPVARLLVELGVWLSAGAALWASGYGTLALAFVLVAVVSGSLNVVWR
jgi:hypothetical protein